MIFVSDVLRAVSLETGVSVQTILSRKRHDRAVNARHIAMFIAYDVMDESFPGVGRMFDRDHTSVMYGYYKVLERMGKNPAFDDMVSDIRGALTGNYETQREQEAHWRLREAQGCEA